MDNRTLKNLKRKIKSDSFVTRCKKASTSGYNLRIDFATEPRTFVVTFTAHSTQKMKYMSINWKRKSFAIVQDFVNTARSLGCRKFVAMSDTTFVFPKTQRFLSFPHFPFTIEHETSAHGLGQTQLKFVAITFKKSSLGLSLVILGSRDQDQGLELMTNLQAISAARLPELIYTKAQNIAQLFLA
jgi:hypothetical protein